MTNYSPFRLVRRMRFVSLLGLSIGTSIILSLCAPFSVARTGEKSRGSSSRLGNADQQPTPSLTPLPLPKPSLTPSPLPTPTPGDGVRQLTVGPYVPAA